MNLVLAAPMFFPESFGGGEVYVHRVASALHARGHRVTVVAGTAWKGAPGPAWRVARHYHGELPVVTVSVDPAKASPADLHSGTGPLTAALRDVLLGLDPDVVHVNGMKPAAITACTVLGLGHVVTVHHAGVACAAGTLLRPDGSICARTMTPAHCVSCANAQRRPRWFAGRALGAIPSVLYRPLGAWLNGRGRLSWVERGLIHPWLVEQAIAAKRAVINGAQLMVAPSEAMRELLVRNGRDARGVMVVPHGVEPVRAPPPEPLPGRPLRLGYLGRIDPHKGLHVLLDALEHLPGERCELHVFGAARHPWDETYCAQITMRYRGSARVHFHGVVAHDQLASAFASFDVLVVPSLLPEAFGLVVLEAFSAGRPPIVSRAGALPELVRDGVDGLVVERGDPRSLARAIARFLEEPRLFDTLRDGIQPVRTTEEHVRDLLEVYERAARRPHGIAKG